MMIVAARIAVVVLLVAGVGAVHGDEAVRGPSEGTGDKEPMIGFRSPYSLSPLSNPPRPQRYDEHKLIRVQLDTQRDLRTMLSLNAVTWSCRVGLGPTEFIVSPEQLAVVREAGLEFVTLVDDVQQLIDQERAMIEQVRQSPLAGEEWFSVFRTWPEVNAYIDELVNLRPDLIEKTVIGTSIEGRTIYGMKITGPDGPGLPPVAARPGIIYNGCQHAREWVAVMVPMFIADTLVRQYDVDAEIKAIVDQVEFHIIPIVNPDGYEFTYAPDGNRFWRKNRRPHDGSECLGVDLNRNWDIDWAGPHSTSDNPCSDIHYGSEPHSEPEVQYVSEYIAAHPNLRLHIDYHSYSELILVPWGFTTTPSEDFAMLDQLALEMRTAIASVHGVDYEHGIPMDVLYGVSGSMQDWTHSHGLAGYTIELRPDSFNPGFVLPPEEIIPTGEENMAGVLAMAEWVIERHGFSADLNDDGEVNIADLLIVLGAWGPCAAGGEECSADLNLDGVVNVLDLLILLGAWG